MAGTLSISLQWTCDVPGPDTAPRPQCLSGEFRVSESDCRIASIISYSASIGMALAEEAGDVNDRVRFDVQPGLTLADHLI